MYSLISGYWTYCNDKLSMTTKKLGNKKNPKRDVHISPLEGKIARAPSKIGSMGQGLMENRGGNKGANDENMRKRVGQDGGRTERENKERDVLIVGAFMGLA